MSAEARSGSRPRATDASAANGMEPLALEVSDLTAHYGTSQVLFGVSLRVPSLGIVTVLGKNGAGKTTLLNTLTSVLRPTGGRVLISGRDVTGFASERIARLGVGYVPQEQNVFASLSVADNLRIGSLMGDAQADTLEHVFTLFPILKQRMRQRAGSLSGGERKMLAIGRALLSNPSLLLLDEPTEGVWPTVVDEIAHALVVLGHTRAIVLVEQHVQMALRIGAWSYVLELGKVVLEGPTPEVARHPQLYRYLAP